MGFRVCGWGFRDFRLKSLDFLDIQSFGVETGTEGFEGVPGGRGLGLIESKSRAFPEPPKSRYNNGPTPIKSPKP